LHGLVSIAGTLIYRLRVFGARDLPPGPVLVVANHQSHLDPPLLGVAFRSDRPVRFIARSGLFKFGPFAWLIRALGAISLKEGEPDSGAMKLAIAELRAGHVIGIFPEGSRSPDGEMQEFKRGAWLLISRAKCDVVPVAIEGAFAAWPRSRSLPRLISPPIGIAIGTPIPYKNLAGLSADEGLSLLKSTISALREDVRQHMASQSK
jgi:1-acyl-sn-glycerol-3-phosphate acyltransferase